jgi:hypothetical protein
MKQFGIRQRKDIEDENFKHDWDEYLSRYCEICISDLWNYEVNADGDDSFDYLTILACGRTQGYLLVCSECFDRLFLKQKYVCYKKIF